MTCDPALTRPAPITAWDQEGSGFTVSDGLITHLVKHELTPWIGRLPLITGPNAATTWNSTLKRYCRQLSTSTSIHTQVFGGTVEPKALIDPLYRSRGLITRVTDVVHAVFAGPFNAQQGQAAFCIGKSTEITNTQSPWGMIGFRALYDGVTQPNWEAYFNNLDGTALFRVPTGKSVSVPRLLVIELDGGTQEVRWLIDGEEVASLFPASGAGPGQSGANQGGFADPSTYMAVHWMAFGGGNAANLCTLSFLMGSTPLITNQFLDT